MNDDKIYSKYKQADQSELNGYLRGLGSHYDYPKLEHIKYLLTSPELTKHANVHVGNDSLFKELLINIYDDAALDVISYLIFDYNIAKTPTIEKILNFSDSKITDTVKNMFKIRELNESLTNDLIDYNNNSNYKKNKL
jgi:hypothetical protein